MAKRLERRYFKTLAAAKRAITMRRPKLRQPIIFNEIFDGNPRFMVFM